MGLGPIPAIISAEVLPNPMRGTGMALASSTNWIMNFAVTQAFQPIGSVYGWSTAYLIFASTCATAALWFWFVLPETNGRRLEEVPIDPHADSVEQPLHPAADTTDNADEV
jgi:predicted MFS family arabinose efflux permease